MAKSWEEIKKEREEKIRSFSNPVQNNANKLRSEGFLVANPNPQQRKWEDIRKDRGYIEPEPPPIDYWKEQPLRVLGKNINAGINMLPRGMVGVADATIGSLGIEPVNKFLDSYKDYYKKADEELAMLNKGHEFAGGVAQGIGQAIPTMALALMNPAAAVGSAVPTTAKGTQLVANAASLANPTTLNAARAVLSSLKSNPTLYSSMVTSVGNQYLQGLNEGASREEAIKSAIIGGVPSALIEVSGGIENLANIMANKTKGLVGVALQAAIEEGFEEIVQYPIENIGQKVAYEKDMPLFSMKEQAVINPKEMMFSGVVGATVGGLMGGGAAGVNTALYKNYSKQLDTMYKNTIDNLPEDSPILERVRQLQDDNVNIDDNTKLWVINSAREGGMEFESETDKLLQKGRQKETFFSNDNKVQDQLVEQGQNIVKTQNIASHAVNPVLSTFNIQNIENAREVKQSIYEFYKNSIISDSNTSKPILNKSSGMNVEVSRATINQTFQADEKYATNQDNEIKVVAMADLINLIQNGEFTVVDDTDTPSSKVKYAEIKGTVNFNNVPYEITMDIRRTDNGRKLFVHSLSTNYQQVSGKKSGVIYNGVDERVRQQYPKVYDILDRIGKATNTKFKFVDTIYDPTGQIPGFANGQYDPTTDSIEIALDTFNPFMVVAKHELTHMLEKESPKLYKEYKDYVLSVMKENGTYDVQYERMAELYKSRGLEVDKNAIEDELVADATELFLTDEKAINDLVAENKTLGQKILDILRRLIEKIEDILKVSGFTEGWLNTEQLREAERLWVNALSSVVEAKQKTDSKADKKQSLKDLEKQIKQGDYSYKGLPVKYNPALKGEARNHTSYIDVGDKFFKLDRGQQVAVLNHEVAHNNNLFENGRFIEVMDSGIFGKTVTDKDGRVLWEGIFGDVGSNAVEETYAEALRVFDDNPKWLKEKHPKVYEYISNMYGEKNKEDTKYSLKDEELKSDLIEAIERYAEEMNPLERQYDKYGFSVRPPKSNAKYSLKNEVFYTPNNVEVIKNPTDEQIRQLQAEFRKQYPELAKQGEPPTRRTYDIDGNVYYWKSTDGLHYTIEYYIDKKYNTKTEQNKYFDIKYDDKKFSLKAPVEETKDLIAIHNIGEEQLKGILELGGFPVPSIAITKAEQGHDNFGEISVVFTKDTIDPQADRRNRVFGSDVYSKRFPYVNYKVDSIKLNDIRKKIYGLPKEYIDTFGISFDEGNVADILQRHNGNFVEGYINEPILKLLFLKEINRPFKPVMKDKTYGNWDIDLLEKIKNHLGAEEAAIPHRNLENTMKLEPDVRNIINEYYRAKLKGDAAHEYLLYKEPMGFGDMDRLLYQVSRYTVEGSKKDIDYYKTKDKLDKVIPKKAYREWLTKLSEGIIEKKGVRNDKDLFTPSGYRRSFEQLNYEYTLDNIIKLMRGDVRGEEGFMYGLGNVRAGMAKEFKSIEDIKQHKDKIVSPEEFREIKEKANQEYYNLSNQFSKYHGYMIGSSDAFNIAMFETAKKGRIVPSVFKAELKEDGYKVNDIPDSMIKKALDFLNSLKDMPTEYFEAKPQRGVGFDEVAAMVVPKTTDKELLQQLKGKNVKVIKYDEKIEGDRLKKVNSVKGVKFSLKDSQGRTLTQEQAEYFKDSKVRDDKGNLLVMYHGTNRDFNVFWTDMMPQFFTQYKDYADSYATKSNRKGKIKTVYLNITKPFDTRDKKAFDIFNNEYVEYRRMKNRPINKIDSPRMINFVEADGLYPFLRKMQREGKLDYDGIVVDESIDAYTPSYVPLQSEQIKEVTNKAPTKDKDIRYSLKDEDGVNYLKSAIKNFDFIVKTSDKSKLLERTKNGSIIHINKVDDDGTVIYSTSWGPARTKVSEFIEKINNGEIVEVGLKRGLTKDEILEKIRAEREKALKTFNPKSVEPKKVSISESATYRGQDMEWTETYIGKTVLKAGEKAYHTSYRDISSFYPKETCFYESYKLNVIGGDKNIYCLIPKKDIIVSEYSGDGEIRVDLERYKNDVDIYYIGYGESFSVKDDFDRVVGKFTLQHLAPEESYSTNNQIKYQLRDNKSAKDVEKLQNTVTRLKEQFKLTKGVKLDEKAVRRLAKAILKDYGSRYSASELETKLYNVYMGMVNGTMEYDEAHSIITEVARDIIENASVLNDAMYKQYSELRNTMRNTAISIDDRYKGDFDAVGGWNDFRKRNFGRMNITNDGMSIDKLYQELSDSYPELFLKDVANPADQLMLISDVLDSLVPIYENPYNRELNEAVEYLALEIFDGMTSVPEAKPTFADRKKAEKQKAVKAERDKSKARIEALKNKNAEDIAWLKYQNKEKLAEVLQKEKAKRDEAVAKVRKQYQDNAYKTWWRNKLNENDIKSHYQEMIKELRINRDEKLEQQKTKYKERISGIYEDRKIRQAKDRIRTMAKKLDKMLRSPTQKQHIPKALDKTIAELLTMLDFTTDRQKETTQIKLRDLRAEYEKIAKVSDEDGLSATADPYIVEALEMLHNKRIVDMNLQEIELLRDIVGYFENMVRTYNKAFLGDKWIDVSTKAEGIIKDLETDTPMTESAYGGILYFKDMMNWGMLTPQMFFERMGNTFNSLYDDFRAALDVKINNTKIAQDYMSNLLADSKDKVKEWTGKKAEIKTIKLDSGKTIELTQSQLMSFYLLMKREQARGHIFGLGIKAAPIVAVNNKGIKYVKKQFEPVKITLDDATRMIAMLSKEQRRIADGIGKFMNTYSKQWVNEATLQNYGYELAKEENYFPIKVDRDFLKSDFDNTNLDPTFTSMGFLKATIKGAGNAIILEDVFDVFTEHADKAATYNAFVGVTESTKKIVNYKTQDNSIKQAMNKKFGIQAFNYLKKFMVDLQGGIRTESGSPIVTGLIRRAKRAVLGLNLRTIIQQPTAIVRASALIDVDYLIKGVAMKSDKAEMLEKSPIARWKSWGYFNLDTGRSMKDIILDTVPILDKQYQGMQIADDITWTKIWNAVKLEIEDNEPGLKVGSAEYFDAVNYRFNEIIDRTQVVDTVMHRSDAMRQSDSSWKILTAFMSEPTKSYNLLLNAVEKYSANKSVENKKVLLRTFSAWTATMLVNTLVISIFDMWRKKEDDKETFKDKWIDNILNDVTGYVPIVRDIYSLFEGYSVKRMEYNGIERIVRAINRSKKYIEEIAEDKKHSYPLRLITKDWIESVAYVFGVGAINVSKDLEALLRNYTRWIDDEGVVNDIYEFMFKK